MGFPLIGEQNLQSNLEDGATFVASLHPPPCWRPAEKKRSEAGPLPRTLKSGRRGSVTNMARQ